MAPGVRVRSPPRARPLVRAWAAPTTIPISIPPPLAPTTPPPTRATGQPAGCHLPFTRPSGQAGERRPSGAPAPPRPVRGTTVGHALGHRWGMPAGGHRHGITAGAFRLAQSVPPGCLPPGPTALPAVRDPPSWPTFQPGAAGPVASRLSTYSPTPFGGQKCQQALICTKVAGRDILHYGGGPSTAFFPYKVGHPPGPVTQFKGTWSKLCARSAGGSTARPVCTARGNGRIPWGRGVPTRGAHGLQPGGPPGLLSMEAVPGANWRVWAGSKAGGPRTNRGRQ